MDLAYGARLGDRHGIAFAARGARAGGGRRVGIVGCRTSGNHPQSIGRAEACWACQQARLDDLGDLPFTLDWPRISPPRHPCWVLVGCPAGQLAPPLRISNGGRDDLPIAAGACAAVSALAAAGISLALNLAPNPYAAYEIMTWLLGSLSDRSWLHVLLVTPFIAVGGMLLFSTARALDALALGEAQAQSLGINLRRLYVYAIFGTALAVGASTAVTGAIGFIGLVAPHLVRPLVKHQPSRVLLPAALSGALLLLIADVATRLFHAGSELKLGVLTSLIGTPFFFWLVVRLRKMAP